MANLWQHPYVNVFKHFNISTWKKSTKEGEVMTVMDKAIKCTVYRITGSIPSSNYIQLPATSTQSLGLTGRYLYLLFKPIASKYFVAHIDVVTQDALVVRISFSNLFKEFKSTSTWLQFPFVCHASKGSLHDRTSVGTKDHSGPSPMTTQWTVLCLDFQYILSMYLNRKYSYVKNIRLCANMHVKNVFTSDMEYEPGITMEQVKKLGLSLHGLAPVPREMAFPLAKGEKWHNHYNFIRFPSDATDKIHKIEQLSDPRLAKTQSGPLGVISPKSVPIPITNVTSTRGLDKPSSHRQRMQDKRARQSQSRQVSITRELPVVGVSEMEDIVKDDRGDIHVYAHPEERTTVHISPRKSDTITNGDFPKAQKYKGLKPDPILALRRIVGFGGAAYKDVLWTKDTSTVVYPCHAVVVAMNVKNGYQRFLVGHTDKVTCLTMNHQSTLLASGQTGPTSVVRIWRFQSAECLAMVKTHSHSLSCLSFSHSGSVLAGVGKDGHGKNMVVIWNTSRVTKGGEVSVMAKAHSDVDIVRMRIAAFDDTRMVSCGRDNIRLWRVREGALRSTPVNLKEYHTMEFTDCCFEAGFEAQRDPLDRIVYVCSRSGYVFEIDYQNVTIHHVRRLLPTTGSKSDKQTFSSGPGISINSMNVNESFCVMGSDDGYLRLWPLDFSHVYLEAEHEGPVSAVQISSDGLKLLAGTTTGNLGVLDIPTRGYTTIMRSHTDRVLCVSVDPLRKHMATVSSDHTIRVWDLDTLQQLFDFSAPQECPCTIAYHPAQQVFACGFENGCVRVFNVATTSMLAEHRQHRGTVIGLAFSPSGEYLYSAGSLGSVALYDATDGYGLLRLLGNTIARGEAFGPAAIAVSPDGKHIAFVGPSEFTISVLDARSLDEVMRIDITSLNPADNTVTVIDTAVRVMYSPMHVKHLLVTTSKNKLFKFDARNGRLLAQIDHIHRRGCTSLDVSRDGRHLLTTGDKVIKVWDYHMRLDLNFQVFIGHSENVSKVMFTPDALGVVSVGEAIFLWDFLANMREKPHMPEGRTESSKNYIPRIDAEREEIQYRSPVRRRLDTSLTDMPRRSPPKPSKYSPLLREGLSTVHPSVHETGLQMADLDLDSSDKEEVLIGPDLQERNVQTDSETESVAEITGHESLGHDPQVSPHRRHLPFTKQPATQLGRGSFRLTKTSRPTVHKHFIARNKQHALAQRRYTAPPNQAGLKLQSVIGYNGNGRGNMIWQSDIGLFIYTSGCVIVVEDLNTSNQRHLLGHVEEISTLALQNDCQVLASSSGAFKLVTSQICLWDLQDMTCKKVLSQHEHAVVSLAFSRDDRFLVSVGDYRECTVVVWDMRTYNIVTTSKSSHPIHDLCWDPYTMNEFTTVGQNGTVLFWMIDETGAEAVLNVHEAVVPEDLLQTHHLASGQVDFTSLAYAGDNTVFIGTNTGKISAWDTRHNSCFLHWEADTTEIGIVLCHAGRMITGSIGRSLKLWSTVGVGELKLPGNHYSMRREGLTMEDELILDGPITAAAFDNTMDMGIVGTGCGTLWYINWTERSSIRLVSGHMDKVSAIAFANNEFFASCANDGTLRVWSLQDREQTIQFQVMDQSCTCIAFSPPDTTPGTRNIVSNLGTTSVTAHASQQKFKVPNVIAGYSDGTIRMFDLNKVEMVLKMHPHAVPVTAIKFSADGRMILSGGSDGLIAVSSPSTCITVRVISDHKGAPITNIDVSVREDSSLSSPHLWLAVSADRRVSVWSADWNNDSCELVDWLTFPAPSFAPDGTTLNPGREDYYAQLPPSLAYFSLQEPDIIVYVGYGMQRQVQFYSLKQRKVVRNSTLAHWASHMALSPNGNLLALGANERLLEIMDYYEGSFQDFIGHSDIVNYVQFSPNGKLLVTVSHDEMFVWEVMV